METPKQSQKELMEITWIKGVQLDVKVRGHRILTDQPLEEGGTDEGMTPVEMLVASLGSCIGYFAVRFYQRHEFKTAGLRVAMEWGYAEQPHRIGSLTAHVHLPVKLDSTMRDRLQKVLDGCTIHNSIRIAPKIEVRLSTPH
ncbi:MAG: OsmC family protein [Nitrospirae bacterium]|nr:OsmC family protein [Nitrospirota bacterium]